MAWPLRILHVLRAPVGGLFRHVRDLSLAQVEHGHEVGVLVDGLSCDGLTDERLAVLEDGLPLGVHRIDMPRSPGASDLPAILETRRLARELEVSVLHGHGAKGGLYARLAGRLRPWPGKPIARFYTPHGGSLHYFQDSLKGRAYVAAEAALAQVSDGIIFESAYAEGVYTRAVGDTGVAQRVIPNGLQPEDFDVVVADEGAAEFLFIGELRELKGVDLLLKALARVKTLSFPRAVIVGDGPDAGRFKALARELGIAGQVTFTGAMPARQALSLGRTLVMPSRAESLPYVALEAAAAGLPLIASNVGGLPEIVRGSGTRLVASGNVEALACAMATTIDGFEEARARAVQLRGLVAQRFTVARMTGEVLDFYRTQLARKSSGRVSSQAILQDDLYPNP